MSCRHTVPDLVEALEGAIHRHRRGGGVPSQEMHERVREMYKWQNVAERTEKASGQLGGNVKVVSMCCSLDPVGKNSVAAEESHTVARSRHKFYSLIPRHPALVSDGANWPVMGQCSIQCARIRLLQ